MNKKEEIFTIGDECEKGIISSFSVFGNDLLITYDNGSTQPLKNAKKLKKPLFTSEDGVEIYEGDKVYYLDKYDFSLKGESPAGIAAKSLNGCWLFYSSKEKAEEHILMNKPCLSINDFLLSKDTSFNALVVTTLSRLRELAKSKLYESKN